MTPPAASSPKALPPESITAFIFSSHVHGRKQVGLPCCGGRSPYLHARSGAVPAYYDSAAGSAGRILVAAYLKAFYFAYLDLLHTLPPIRIRLPRLEPGWFWGFLDIIFQFWEFLVARYESYLIVPGVPYHVGFGDRIAKMGLSI